MSLRQGYCLLNVFRRMTVFKIPSNPTNAFNILDMHKLLYRRNYKVNIMSLSRKSSAISNIQFEDLNQQLKNSKIILIDVRESDELIKEGKIPGSINIPMGNIEKAFSMAPDEFQSKYGISYPSKSKSQIVFSCRSGRRATMAAEQVQKLGFSDVKCYLGSFIDWVEKGGEVQKS